MDELKNIEKGKNIKVVTANSLISAPDIAALSLNARKLLYIAMAQCKYQDSEFFDYQTTPTELAELWGIDRSNIYRVCDEITTELMKIVIKIGDKSYDKIHIFAKCHYDDAKVTFKLHKDMTEQLLGLKKDFSKPLLWDFMRMKSRYSIAVWHLMQREMHSFKPMLSSPIEFELTLDELRAVTGTQNKFKQISEFKARVLDRALDEIRDNCWTDITYDNIKTGRVVTGFRFTAKNIMGVINAEDLSLRQRKQARKALLIKKKADGTLSPREYNELQNLIEELSQMTMEDFF